MRDYSIRFFCAFARSSSARRHRRRSSGGREKAQADIHGETGQTWNAPAGSRSSDFLPRFHFACAARRLLARRQWRKVKRIGYLDQLQPLLGPVSNHLLNPSPSSSDDNASSALSACFVDIYEQVVPHPPLSNHMVAGIGLEIFFSPTAMAFMT